MADIMDIYDDYTINDIPIIPEYNITYTFLNNNIIYILNNMLYNIVPFPSNTVTDDQYYRIIDFLQQFC
jgi:hypothetical protein